MNKVQCCGTVQYSSRSETREIMVLNQDVISIVPSSWFWRSWRNERRAHTAPQVQGTYKLGIQRDGTLRRTNRQRTGLWRSEGVWGLIPAWGGPAQSFQVCLLFARNNPGIVTRIVCVELDGIFSITQYMRFLVRESKVCGVAEQCTQAHS